MQYNNNQNYYNQQKPNFSGSYYQPPVGQPYQPVFNAQSAAYLRRKRDINELISAGFIIGAVIVIYLIMQIIAVTVLSVMGLNDIYSSSSLFQNCFNIVAVHLFSLTIPFGIMALILKKRFTGPIIPSEKIGFVKGFMWVSVGMGCCLLANIVTNYVIALFKVFGYELTQSELLNVDSPIACIALVFSTAIVPGVCEEFAMRCCTLGVLKKYGKGFAVFAVSVVFGLIHGNIIQFIFAFLVGLALGYITVKTNNIVPAMFVHGLNNGLSVISDIFEYAISKDFADNAITVIYIAWIVLSVIGLIYLIFKKELLPAKKGKKPGEPYALSFGTKLLCLLPGFFVPFLILIYMSVKTIVPIAS